MNETTALTQNHPITPPPELVEEWATMLEYHPDEKVFSEVAQWGADQELDACVEWLQDPELNVDTYKLRASRRPKVKPPSKEEALDQLFLSFDRGYLKKEAADIIRRALEALPE